MHLTLLYLTSMILRICVSENSSSLCSNIPKIIFINGSHFEFPKNCRIVSDSSRNIIPDADRTGTYSLSNIAVYRGNLHFTSNLVLNPVGSEEMELVEVVFTNITSCSHISQAQRIQYEIRENEPTPKRLGILPLYFENEECSSHFSCKLHSPSKSTADSLRLTRTKNIWTIETISKLDRENGSSLPFGVMCSTDKQNPSITFLGEVSISDVNDNSPIPQSLLFSNSSFEIKLYKRHYYKGEYFLIEEIFYDRDLPSSNNYYLRFPEIDYLSDRHPLQAIRFHCNSKRKSKFCSKLPKGFDGSLLYLRDKKIFFTKDVHDFSKRPVKAVLEGDSGKWEREFYIRFMVKDIVPILSPVSSSSKNESLFFFQVSENARKFTRIGVLQGHRNLSLVRMNCSGIRVTDNILFVSGDRGISKLQSGSHCRLELVDESFSYIKGVVSVHHAKRKCDILNAHNLACAEFSLEKECNRACGPGTAGCSWSRENRKLDRTYSTCSVNVLTCPDNKCDALESLSKEICPQDCQKAEDFKGINLRIDEKSFRPIARTKGIVVSCHGKCSAVKLHQGHSMLPELERYEGETGDYECGSKCVLLFTLICGVIFCGIGISIASIWKKQRKRKMTTSSTMTFLSRFERNPSNSSYSYPASFEDEKLNEVDMNPDLFDKKWEFPRNSIVLEETIGEGEFGKVVSAKAFNLGGKGYQRVAVKMLKPYHTREEFLNLLSEYAILKEVDHPNVIKLLGACTDQKGPLLIIMEFALYGSVRSYLQKQKVYFRDNLSEKSPQNITSNDILGFAWQIAKGMDYLVQLKFVHRDLAARNVLLAEGLRCKISDFGLTRDIYTYEAYWKRSKGRLPVKWLSPESLYDNIYTSKSDVWSFGILLWELVTFGGFPYPGIPPERLLSLLKTGYRMEKPKNCSRELYRIMLECWSYNPNSRPKFQDLIVELETMLEDGAKYLDIRDNLVNNETYLEPISSSNTLVSNDSEKNINLYEEWNKLSEEIISSPKRESSVLYDEFSPSPPCIKYSQLIHKKTEEDGPLIA